jgi:hypothetical protein
MKKKVIISFVVCLTASIVAFVIGLGVTTPEVESLAIETPSQIAYFADNTKSEKFKITLPKEYSSKIITTIDEPLENVVRYTYKHNDSGKILFVITVCSNENYKNLTYPYEIIHTSGMHTYLWSQGSKSVEIENKEVKKEFEDIFQYVPTIKSLFVVEQVVNDEEYLNLISENTENTK